MFTDLAGFTTLVEANARLGKEGAVSLLNLLNDYFSSMIEVISKSGGNLLEFTGDAMLIQFPASRRQNETAQAVRAGLRMQRAMKEFETIETAVGTFPLAQRVGIHLARVFTTYIGTPRRMEHALLGTDVQVAKRAEASGEKGRVSLSMKAYERVADEFRFDEGKPGHMLVVDDFSEEDLGEYELSSRRRRLPSAVLMDRSVEGLVKEIEDLMKQVEPLASFIPNPILNLLIETAAAREIPPDFTTPTTIFVNLVGLPEAIDNAEPEEEDRIVTDFSRIFARINAAVEARGGIVKRVTYHLSGSDMLIVFGVPTSHTDDPQRAASAALAIRSIIEDVNAHPPVVGGKEVELTTQIGMALGEAFVAEIGELRGRREFNLHGDSVNTAARLMGKAVGNRILMTQAVKEAIEEQFKFDSLGSMPLKGKSHRMPIFALVGPREGS
jgi:class 3 adenylate cyclase